MHPKRPASGNPLKGIGLSLFAVAFVCYGINLAQEAELIPLPDEVLSDVETVNPLMAMAEKAIILAPVAFSPKIPDSFVIHNDNGSVFYNSEDHSVTYTGGDSNPIFVRTDEGHEIYAKEMRANFDTKKAELTGPLVIYQGESMTRAQHGYYNWEKGEAIVNGVRAKVEGTLVRGSSMEYKKDKEGKDYIRVKDAFVSTEDVEKPGEWVGAGDITIYPGDHGELKNLSVGGPDNDFVVPVLGWIPVSHSLNAKEGYMPIPGVKSIWGSYLRNRYGVLLGNRRVEHGMPVADYIVTGLLDWRSRRGYAGGVEISDEKMRQRYPSTHGFSAYYASDKKPSINPTRIARPDIKRDRYRIALEGIWDIPQLSDKSADWKLFLNSTVLSDAYMLRDFFEDIARVDDKPDNAAWLMRTTKEDQSMLLTRFSTNKFYSTDRRVELSYYRVRTPLKGTRVYYETRNSVGLFNQFITPEQRKLYQDRINNIRYADMRDYYTRLMNTNSYFRVNTTHEFSTSLNIARFLNVTPKLGAGYSGYYNVEGVGTDNRLMGYVGVDFDIKFSRHFKNVNLPSLGINGLYHVFHPYATISHGSITGSNERVPQVDTWSNRLGSSTINPMPLDLMGFTGIDGWGSWTVWRMGTRNTISTVYDGESRQLLNWDMFIDYNLTNPNTESIFSNLFSTLTINPFKQLSVKLETQTPTIRDGDGFHQYNTSVTLIPTAWLEATVGHRYIKDHPVQRDASQAYIHGNLRFSELYSAAFNISWDIQSHRIPIQQYSLFRKCGAWYTGATLFLRNNGGKKETGFGLSITLGETGTAFPINLF